MGVQGLGGCASENSPPCAAAASTSAASAADGFIMVEASALAMLGGPGGVAGLKKPVCGACGGTITGARPDGKGGRGLRAATPQAVVEGRRGGGWPEIELLAR